MQAGRDAQGNFTFELFDETGKGVLIDSTGVQPGAIADGLIVNEMVSDTANIAASKLDIDSLFTAINDSTQVIKSNRIWLDDSGQSLNQAYTKMTQDITDIGEEASEAKETAGRTETKVTEIKSGIDGMSTKMSEISTDLEGVTDGTLLFNVKYEDNEDDTTTVTAVLYKAGKEVTKDYPEAWFSWKRRTEEGETFLQRGYSVTVDNEDYMFGGVVIGEFVRYVEMPLVVGGKLLVIGNKAVCVNVDA